MTTFGEVNQPGSNDRRDGWQKHHVVPTQQHGDDDLTELFQAIQDSNLPADIRYDHNLFDFNGLLLPSTIPDSLAFGFAHHGGSHGAFSTFVQRILIEIRDELQAGDLTAEQAARTVRGFQAYLIDKLTIDTYENELTGESIARPGFYLNNVTPWLVAVSDPDKVAAIYNPVTLDDIRGGFDAANADMSLPFWQGYNSDDNAFNFSGFDYLNRFGTIYDPYFRYDNGVYASSVERFIARESSPAASPASPTPARPRAPPTLLGSPSSPIAPHATRMARPTRARTAKPPRKASSIG